MTPDDFAELVVVTIKKALLGPLVAGRLAALEQRIDDLEARPAAGVEYAGTHEVGKAYRAGQLATKKGGLWLAERSTSGIPGSHDSGWRLVVKEGRAQ